jgi:hypothetical protein
VGIGAGPALIGSTLHTQSHKTVGQRRTPSSLKPPVASKTADANTASKLRVAASYGKLPLSFEANAGQTDPAVKFLVRGGGYALFLTNTEALLSLRKPQSRPEPKTPETMAGHPEKYSPLPMLSRSLLAGGERATSDSATESSAAGTDHSMQDILVSMKLVGANPAAKVSGAEELPGKANYFIGSDPSQWRTGVPTYAKVRYRDVYPGIDLVYYGNQNGQLEYDFVVAPGADPGVIAWDVTAGLAPAFQTGAGGAPLRTGRDGDLVISTGDGELRFHKPVVYQTTGTAPGQRRLLDAGFVVGVRNDAGSDARNDASNDARGNSPNRVHFAIGSYDHSKPLIIDPTLVYSTFLGGKNYDLGSSIAVDSSGNAYVTGYTRSTSFPTASPLQPSTAGYQNVFVVKLNAAGSAMVYSTYLGGAAFDYGLDIALDSSGGAYLTGFTTSTNFPTINAIQPAFSGASCGFVTALNPAGSALVYSTYLGGSRENVANSIAVDPSGNAYVTGYTSSADFPTASPFQPSLAGPLNAFVTELSWNGSALSLAYSTYLGGSTNDWGQGIAVDSSGNAYVTGYTMSGDFPTANPIQGSLAGFQNAFVTKLNWNGSALSLVYSTYLGGKLRDYAQAIAVDSSGNAYITGSTSSNNFPTASPFQASLAGPFNAFVSKLNWNGAALSLAYSTYLGGNSNDAGYGIAVDSSGNAYITGATYSTNFPTLNPLQATFPNIFVTGFVAGLNTTGSALLYSTYLGGNLEDAGIGIAVDSSGNAYVTGSTRSTNFPTSNPIQVSLIGRAGAVNAFVARISPLTPGISLASNGLTFANQAVQTTSLSQSVLVTSTGTGPLTMAGVTITGDFALATTGTSCPYSGGNLGAQLTCTIDVTFTPTASGARTGSVTITDNTNNGLPGATQSIGLTGTGIYPLIITASSGSMNYGGIAPAITPSYSGFQNGDTPASLTTQPTCATTATSATPVGSYPSTCMGAVDPNYTITYVAGSVTVGPVPLAVTAASATITYGAAVPAITPSYAGFQNGDTPASLSAQPICTTTATSASPVGPYPSTCTGAVDPNYTISYLPGSVVLNPAPLIVTAPSVTIGAGSGIPTFTPAYSGFVNGQSASSLSVQPGCITTANSSSPSGNYPITCSGAVDSNYTISYVAGTLTITGGGGGGTTQVFVFPSSLNFSSQPVQGTSSPQDVIVVNFGHVTLQFTNISTSGDFAQTNNCNGSLASYNYCVISVTFTPSTTGTLNGALMLSGNAQSFPLNVSLTGSGQ